MAKQFHYVVFYDTETKEWAMEFDVELNGGNGDVFDTETQEWSKGYLYDEVDDVICQDLNKRLGAKE
jgi:hypothetical protein